MERKRSPSSIGTPSSSAITVIGSGRARSAIRSNSSRTFPSRSGRFDRPGPRRVSPTAPGRTQSGHRPVVFGRLWRTDLREHQHQRVTTRFRSMHGNRTHPAPPERTCGPCNTGPSPIPGNRRRCWLRSDRHAEPSRQAGHARPHPILRDEPDSQEFQDPTRSELPERTSTPCRSLQPHVPWSVHRDGAAGFAVYRAHRGVEQIQHQIRRCHQPLDSGCAQNRISTLWSHARQSLSIHSSA